MNGVTTNLKCLSYVSEFNILKTSNQGVITFRMKEYGCTILILCRSLRVTSELDIPCQEPDLCTHINKFVTIPLNLGKVFVI